MKYILPILIVFFLNSCNKKTESDFPELIHNDLEYKLSLPDTVKVNKPYKVTIEFKSDFDKIIDAVQINPHDSTKMRLITYYNYKPIKSPMNSLSNFFLIDSTFVLNKKFEINNIVFKEKGEYFFYGLILDEMSYEGYNEKGILNSVEYDDLKQQIVKKVVVIE
ncbi:hypothetical protein [Flavobacterium sp. I3-2]|uniref:hypothetical protein n=1 Tax=Flavobacterium sp. I3-2 TaxID=2748319 RepID=UPI0015ABA7BD|nr:hypothetical protein [Flavobacterium sp. I3-2]